MIRRRFMQLFGLVPAIIPMIQATNQINGRTFHNAEDRDVKRATIFMYGRAEITSLDLATRYREQFIAGLDAQLRSLKNDAIRYYDEARAGRKPVSQNKDGQKFIGDVL